MVNFENILIGLAIGDAFGAGVEFQDRNWVRQNVDFTQFINGRPRINVGSNLKKNFTENYKPWNYTDDTEMTIGVIKALLSEEKFSERLLIENLLKEYKKGIKEKGFGRNGHGSLRWFFSDQKTIDEIKEFQRNRLNPGNAPAVRAIPFGFIKGENIDEYARINAMATHPNINATIASVCIARATEYILVKKGRQPDLIKYCMGIVDLNKEYQSHLSNVDNLGDYDGLTEEGLQILCGPQPIREPYFLPGINGIPSDSKYTTGAALYILKNCSDTFDALKMSVHLGGDVDSVAAITTGVMAGNCGLGDLPEFMVENVEGVEYLKSIAKLFSEKYFNGKIKK